MKNLEEQLKTITSLVFDDRIIMFKNVGGRPSYVHANPEFAGTGKNGDFFYNPFFMNIENIKKDMDDDDFKSFMDAIALWRKIAPEYYAGKISLSFLGQEKTAAIFLLNFFNKLLCERNTHHNKD